MKTLQINSMGDTNSVDPEINSNDRPILDKEMPSDPILETEMPDVVDHLNERIDPALEKKGDPV
jgi:hypothetical protein